MTADGPDAPAAPAVPKPGKDYRGVRGWLLLMCLLMVLVSPVLRGMAIYDDVLAFIALGSNASLEPGLVANVRSAVGIEIVLVFCSLVLSLTAGIALFKEKWFAPRLAKAYWASGPILNALLLLDLWVFFPPEVFQDTAMKVGRDLVSSFLGAALWISYLNRSKRVKATYPQRPVPTVDGAGEAD